MNESDYIDQRYVLTVRSFPLNVETIPKHWFADNVLLTHAINAQNMLFPDAERFVIRSVHRHRDDITDPELRDAVKLFIGQEVHHGQSQEQALDMLRAQGFQIDGWLSRYQSYIKMFERIAPAWLCLSVTVAIEHFTARVAECCLTEGRMEEAHPDMAAMLGWHAAEEIEHKAVAFDVLQQVEPRWLHRMLGVTLAIVFLLLALISGTALLLRQDPEATWSRVWKERQAAGKENIRATRFIERHLGPYLAFDFHPNNHDNIDIAREYLARIEDRYRERRSSTRLRRRQNLS